jgi:hypothetical protein
MFQTQKTARVINGAACITGFRINSPASRRCDTNHPKQSALASFETRLRLVDDVSAATAANHAVIAVAAFEGLKRIDDFHRDYPL